MPKTVNIEAKTVAGISVRTDNAAEMNPAAARLPGLWERFYREQIARRIPGACGGSPVYGAYWDYESDASGAYQAMAGVEVDPRAVLPAGYARVTLDAGTYLLFQGRGEMPTVVFATWSSIWNFFAAVGAPARAYRTDFEVYRGPDAVDVYIGVK